MAPKAPPALVDLPSNVRKGPFIPRPKLNVPQGACEWTNSEEEESDSKETEKYNQANVLPEWGNAGMGKIRILNSNPTL